MNEKKVYSEPEIEIINISNDIEIVTSGGENGEGKDFSQNTNFGG